MSCRFSRARRLPSSVVVLAPVALSLAAWMANQSFFSVVASVTRRGPSPRHAR